MMLRLAVLLARQLLPEPSWQPYSRFLRLALTLIVAPRAMTSRAAASSPLGLDPVRASDPLAGRARDAFAGRDRDALRLVVVIEMLLLLPPVVAPTAAVVVVGAVVVVACDAILVMAPMSPVVVVGVETWFTTAVMPVDLLPLKVGAPR